MEHLFSAVANGSQLYGDPSVWGLARNSVGDTLLHVAARTGRLYAVWILLRVHPRLASEPNNNLDLPEDVACSDAAQNRCIATRKQFYLRHEAL